MRNHVLGVRNCSPVLNDGDGAVAVVQVVYVRVREIRLAPTVTGKYAVPHARKLQFLRAPCIQTE